MNSPEKVMHRLIHSDYFNHIGIDEIELFYPKIMIHLWTCDKAKCKRYRTNGIVSS